MLGAVGSQVRHYRIGKRVEQRTAWEVHATIHFLDEENPLGNCLSLEIQSIPPLRRVTIVAIALINSTHKIKCAKHHTPAATYAAITEPRNQKSKAVATHHVRTPKLNGGRESVRNLARDVKRS